MSSYIGSVALGPTLTLWASVTVSVGMITLVAHVALSFSGFVTIKTRQCFIDSSKMNVKVKLGLFSLGQAEKPPT